MGRTGTKGVPREEREEQILDCATVEFGTLGYVGGSVESIARSAGVSRAMVHAYFGGKDDLYLACVRRAAEPLATAVLDAQDPSADALTRGLSTLRAFLITLEPRRHDWPLIWDTSLPTTAPHYQAVRIYRRRIAGMGLTGSSEVLKRDGDSDATDSALLGHLWLDMVSSVVRWWLRHPEESAEDALHRLARIGTSISHA